MQLQTVPLHNGFFLVKYSFTPHRTATARGKAEQADIAALHARDDGTSAIQSANQYSVDPPPQPPTIAVAAPTSPTKQPGQDVSQQQSKL